jgi:hypothetical protein
VHGNILVELFLLMLEVLRSGLNWMEVWEVSGGWESSWGEIESTNLQFSFVVT